MFTIVIFFAILTLLVCVHELGHLIAAKRAGVKVEEFGLGIPPRIWGIKKGETLYSLNLLPIGGFVKLTGEDMEISGFGDPRSFAVKSPSKRAVILSSGVLGNIILAYLLFTLLFSIGMPIFSDKVQVLGVDKDSVAEKAGIRAGDVIERLDEKEIKSTAEFSSYIKEHEGKEILVVVKRDEKELEFLAVPRPLLGVYISNVKLEKYPWWKAPLIAAKEIIRVLGAMLYSLGMLIYGLLTRKAVPAEVAGPVGIAKLTSFYSELGFRYLLQFISLLSLNLALVNSLPFPALDGGRLAFVAFEGATGKKISPKVEKWVHQVGMALLFLLLILITFHDIARIK